MLATSSLEVALANMRLDDDDLAVIVQPNLSNADSKSLALGIARIWPPGLVPDAISAVLPKRL